MRSESERAMVLSFLDAGLNDCEVARRTGIPRSTVREWRRAPPLPPEARIAPRDACPACGAPTHRSEDLDAAAYAYLLGMYLGDGHIARHLRGVSVLRVFLDNLYPAIINECARAMEKTLVGKRAGIHHHATYQMVIVSMYSKQWPCLFPQHGPGMKHARRIELTGWQRRIVEAEPGRFARGLIHSDGWRGTNRVRVNGKGYAYPRYQFSNRSEDIKRLFCEACDNLGVRWRVMNAMTISVARRESVARLDEFVGFKR